MPNTSVTEAISQIDNTGATPSGQGHDPLKASDTRSIEQVMAENKRKAEEITTLKAENERITTQLESQMETQQKILEELKSIRNPNANQQNAINQAQLNVDALADELEHRQDAQGWNRLSERNAEKVVNNTFTQREIIEGNRYLRDMASELKIPVKELIQKLEPYAGKYAYDNEDGYSNSPARRNQLALKEWKADQERLSNLTKREKDVEEEKIQLQLMREGRGRIPIDNKKQEAWDQAVERGDMRGKTRAVVDLIGTQTIVTR